MNKIEIYLTAVRDTTSHSRLKTNPHHANIIYPVEPRWITAGRTWQERWRNPLKS